MTFPDTAMSRTFFYSYFTGSIIHHTASAQACSDMSVFKICTNMKSLSPPDRMTCRGVYYIISGRGVQTTVTWQR